MPGLTRADKSRTFCMMRRFRVEVPFLFVRGVM